MSLAGAQGSLWSVEGGNKLVCSGLLKLTKANVIHATVTSVTLQQTGESTGRGRRSWTADTPTFSVPEPWSATSRGGSVEPVGSPALTPEGTVVPSQATAPSGRASPTAAQGCPAAAHRGSLAAPGRGLPRCRCPRRQTGGETPRTKLRPVPSCPPPDGKPLYQVWYENEAGVGSDYYDIVVIATPLHPDSGSSITFGGFDPPIAVAQGPFQPTVVSLVHGYLNSSYFGFPDPKLFPFATILTTDFPSFFLALDNLCPVNVSASFRRRQPQEAAVWRVRSPQPLLRSQLKTLFRSYYSVQTAEWQAHPVHSPHGPLPRFMLHDQLFHLNALEWAASSVEVTAVAAKNVALLAFNRWYQDLDKIDQKDLMHKVKTEL